MDLMKMLAELRKEQDQVAQAIVSLERLALTRGKRPERPPGPIVGVRKRGRPLGSKNKIKAESYPLQ